MTDGADERGHALRGGSDERLRTERQEVLERAPAPRDDDDVHGRVRVELADGGRRLWHAVGALHRYAPNLEPDRRPALACVDDDVVLGVTLVGAHEPHEARNEGQ